MLRLVRSSQTVHGTFGAFIAPDVTVHTIEKQWRDAGLPVKVPCGQKGLSCIPPGVYTFVFHHTEAHPKTIALVNPDLWVYHTPDDVPPDRRPYARTAVLIHPANYEHELRGCIAPGFTKSPIGVFDSRRAFAAIRHHLTPGNTIEISYE